MSLRRRRLVLAGVLTAVAAFAAGVALRQYSTTRSPKSGTVSEKAVAGLFGVQLPDSSGRLHAFAQWRGKALVINFWATWCAPCREEMPYFSRIAEKHAAKGVQFVGISTDSPDAVRSFAEQYRIAYPLLVGGPGAIELSATLGNSLKGLPYTIILGPNGEPLLTRIGRLPESELEKLLDRLN